jgi:terminase small subunit-like protein
MPGGRPSLYTPELAQRFCDRLGAGELGIEIVQEPEMPDIATIRRWREAHPEFRAAYAHAREMQAQACAERAVISGRKATAEDAGAARVRFDADRWLAAKLDPKNYGDRVDHNIAGDLNIHRVLSEAPLTIEEWTEANVIEPPDAT